MRGVWLRGRMECAFNGSVTGQCKQAGDPLPRGGTTMRVPTETPTKRAESQEIERVYGPAQPPLQRTHTQLSAADWSCGFRRCYTRREPPAAVHAELQRRSLGRRGRECITPATHLTSARPSRVDPQVDGQARMRAASAAASASRKV